MIGLRTRAPGARWHIDRLAFIFEHVQPGVPVAGIDQSIPRHIASAVLAASATLGLGSISLAGAGGSQNASSFGAN